MVLSHPGQMYSFTAWYGWTGLTVSEKHVPQEDGTSLDLESGNAGHDHRRRWPREPHDEGRGGEILGGDHWDVAER
jgi:hypothetical protein